ncbi:MAG: DUF3037 domain-containing protein [Candidatus Sericytochromatia bacterium]
MPTHCYEYAIIRVMPRVERQEFINVGVLLSCHPLRYLATRLDWDPARLLAFAPSLDLALIGEYAQITQRVCQGEGPIGALPLRERFHWLVAPRSTVIQLSPVHSGFCDDPGQELERLLDLLVRPLRA